MEIDNKEKKVIINNNISPGQKHYPQKQTSYFNSLLSFIFCLYLLDILNNQLKRVIEQIILEFYRSDQESKMAAIILSYFSLGILFTYLLKWLFKRIKKRFLWLFK